MKKLMLILLLSVFLVGCQQSFESNFNNLEKLSKKHDTSFFKEEINTSTIAPLKEIAPLIEEIEKVQAEDNASQKFIDARINMLKSQLYWHLALGVGPAGFASDGFRCQDHKDMVKTNEYLNKSHRYGLKATLQLDELLTDYPEHRKIIGIKEGPSDTRSNFYFSPLGWMRNQIRLNEQSFKTYCLEPFKNFSDKNDSEVLVKLDPTAGSLNQIGKKA